MILLLLCLLCSVQLGCAVEIKQHDWGEEFFTLARVTLEGLLPQNRGSLLVSNSSLSRVHLLRIPKASSTSLSVIARRMVGCNPPGPCCKYPGDPVGSCPSKALFACETSGKVVGCTHHYPNERSLRDPSMSSITMLREPVARSISAYFYPGIHHNSLCTRGLYQQSGQTKAGMTDTGDELPDRIASKLQRCFVAYTSDSRFENIATKMLTGTYAYAPSVGICEVESACPGKSLQRALETIMLTSARNSISSLSIAGRGKGQSLFVNETGLAGREAQKSLMKRTSYPFSTHLFVGISELWELSVLLLHTFLFKARQVELSPLLSDFSVHGNRASRDNKNEMYINYKKLLHTPSNLQLLYRQNQLDLKLYKQALVNICREVQTLGLHRVEFVRKYWTERIPALSEIQTESGGGDISWISLSLDTCAYAPLKQVL